MSLTGKLAAFALRHALGKSADKAIDVLERHFADHSRLLPDALSRANDRAWQTVGLAVAGDTLFDRARGWARGGDMIALRDQFRAFLASTPTGLEAAPADVRARACDELNQLRKAGRLTLELNGSEVAADIRRYSDPSKLVAGATEAVAAAVDSLTDAPNLTTVLRIAPPGGAPLLATAFLYFFRREVETNAELARGCMFGTIRELTVVQERGFALLDSRTAGILDQFDTLFDALSDWFACTNAKIDAVPARVKEVVSAELKEALQEFEHRRTESRKPGVSYDNAAQRDVLRRVRNELRRNPDRVGAEGVAWIARALSTAGLYAEAGAAHEEAAATAREAGDTGAEAANHYAAYLDACAAGDWTRAAERLWKAVALEQARYRPFDHRRYTPLCILGGGAFGTVFHCHDEYDRDDDDRPRPVAIKSFRTDALDRDLRKVFAEALTLKKLAHPSIIGVIDQGFGDPAARTRPYLVLEYFPGRTLDQHVAESGPLPVPDFLAVARQVAEAVHAAHTRPRPIYHRDLKPSNVMVLRNSDGTWAVKVIDFGLAVGAAVAKAGMSVPPADRSTRERSVTGTIRYAPPEQRGELPGVEVGPYSDVYSFGKTCLDALLRTVEPKSWDWKRLPEECRGPLQELLERCTAESLEHRFPSFAPVLDALAELDSLEKVNRVLPIVTERSGEARWREAEREQEERIRLEQETADPRRRDDEETRKKAEEARAADALHAASDDRPACGASFEVGRVYRCASTVPLEEADRISSSGPCAFWDKSLEAGAVFSVDGLWDSGKAHIAVLEGHPPNVPDRVNMEDYFVSSDNLARCVAVPVSECISLLGRLIRESKRSSVVYDAVQALGHIGWPETLPALTEAVRNREGYVRFHAVAVLAKVGDGSVIPALEQLLTDEWSEIPTEEQLRLLADETWLEWKPETRSVAECAREAIDRISARDPGSPVVLSRFVVASEHLLVAAGDILRANIRTTHANRDAIRRVTKAYLDEMAELKRAIQDAPKNSPTVQLENRSPTELIELARSLIPFRLPNTKLQDKIRAVARSYVAVAEKNNALCEGFKAKLPDLPPIDEL